MGTTFSKATLVQEEIKLLRSDLSELQKESAAAKAKTEALEEELRNQRQMIRELDAFAAETKEALSKLDQEMDSVYNKVYVT